MIDRRNTVPPARCIQRVARRVSFAVAVTFPLISSANPIQLGVGLQERYSDNVRLTHDNKQSDLESRAFITLDQHSQGRCNSDVNGELGYSSYLNNTYSNQTDARLGLNGNCQLTGGLSWNLSDNLRQVPANNALPSTPSNAVRENIVSTGPSWVWLLSPTNRVNAAASVQNTKFWNTSDNTVTLNNNRRNSREVDGSLGWTHLLDPSSSAGLSTKVTRTIFNDDETLTNRSANVNASKRFTATTLSGSFGYSRLNDDIQGLSNTYGGPIWNIRIDRQINEHASWYFLIHREFTTTSSAYPIDIAGFIFNYAQSSTVKVTSYRWGYTNQLGSGSELSVNLGRDESDHLLTHERDVSNLVDANYQMPLSQTLTAVFGLGYQHQHFDYSNSTNDTSNAYIGTSYQQTKALSLNVRLGHNLRHSNISFYEYAENFVIVGLRYNFR